MTCTNSPQPGLWLERFTRATPLLVIILGSAFILPNVAQADPAGRQAQSLFQPSAQPVAEETQPALIPLKQRLQVRDWAGADRETRRLFAPNSVQTQPPSNSVALSPEMIRAIDQTWEAHSHGRFGLGVQLRLWQAAKAAHPKDETAAINAFRDRVGWKLTKPRSEQDFISSDWRNESELNYSLQAPEGHFPWVGVSDQVVQSIAVPPAGEHCGSCTTDAMQLRNERFYSYLPLYISRLQAALPGIANLEGITWQLSEWRSSSGQRIALLPTGPITLRFQGPQISGSSGCNGYSASYQLQGAQLRLPGAFTTTLKRCEPAVEARGNWFFSALKASQVTLRSTPNTPNRLTIEYTTAAGKGVLVFNRQK
jgi:heat shock protein HslJ